MLEQLIDDIYSLLSQNKGAMLVFPKNIYECQEIKKIIIDCKMPISFSNLSSDGDFVMLLRYSPYIENFCLSDKLIAAHKFDEIGDYSSALECYLDLLMIGNPKVQSYMNIAVLYSKLCDYENSIKYLKIAYYLDRKDGKDVTRLEALIHAIQDEMDIDYQNNLKSLLESAEEQLDMQDHITLTLKPGESNTVKYALSSHPKISIKSIKKEENFEYMTFVKNKRYKR